MNKNITLVRACKATIIPAGDEVTLAEGASFTIGEEIKQEVLKEKEEAEDQGPFSEEKVWDAMRGCYDPEIPVNIVDLGLIYDLRVEEGNDGKQIFVKMTLTAQGCGMGPVIADDAKQRILRLPSVESAEVDIVWDPPWNPRMISEEGKKVLGLE
jgi:metal-sulfur cluster biosynthetic enzyme